MCLSVLCPNCVPCCSSLSEVLEELEAIPIRYRGPGDFIADQLSHIEREGQSFNRSTFEQHRTVTSGGTLVGGHQPVIKQVMSSQPGSRIPVCEACKQQIK
ncbi:unnamed protein product [Cylicostephanus goldi]|uniref:Uncharacterized protein n=1 Tax=Cylicostephanus goldi TaxID=71465 RepID=A0A3P6UTG4_CYLGO|nr:unnamed protein product [Cylicostephanus goldi]